MVNNKTKIIGLWDTTITDNKLGSLLLFQEEVLLLSKINESEQINLIFTYNEKANLLHFYSSIVQLNPYAHDVFYTSTLKLFEILNFEKLNSYTIIWPTDAWRDRCSYTGSTLAIQDLWKRFGKIINLETPINVLRKAARWLSPRLNKRLPVVIHLRNNPEEQIGNANMSAWTYFFEYCQDKGYPALFILIGNDPIDKRLSSCKNILVVKDHWQSVELDLALIELGVLFMGMSSGPCNMAILSDKPYLIWKNPNHHADQMIVEFNGRKQFPFAKKNQRFIRDWDTKDRLIEEFESVYPSLNINNWQDQFNKYLYDI
ncbi:MAG: hypothetical protein WC856_06680 [Methylococcaceae bacterium]|jgi:hypothetical protein